MQKTGRPREHALEMIEEAVALHRGGGESVTDGNLREWGINPDGVPDEPHEPDAPWFDQQP